MLEAGETVEYHWFHLGITLETTLETTEALQNLWIEQVHSSGTRITHCLWSSGEAGPGVMESRLYSVLDTHFLLKLGQLLFLGIRNANTVGPPFWKGHGEIKIWNIQLTRK